MKVSFAGLIQGVLLYIFLLLPQSRVVPFLWLCSTGRVSHVSAAHDYSIVHENLEAVKHIPEFIIYEASVAKYNQSTPVLNFSFKYVDPKVHHFMTWVDGYERLGADNTYVRSAISVSATICDFVAGKFYVNKGMHRYGNMPPKCPLQMGKVYYVHNYIVEDDCLFPTIPGNRWRMDVRMGPAGKKNTNESILLQYYFKIVRRGKSNVKKEVAA